MALGCRATWCPLLLSGMKQNETRCCALPAELLARHDAAVSNTRCLCHASRLAGHIPAAHGSARTGSHNWLSAWLHVLCSSGPL